MRKQVLVLGVVLAVIALPSFAAVEYEFTQKATTEDPVVPTTEFSAKAVVDGTRTRVDFRSGTLYPPGTYAVTTDSRRVYFVDPEHKSYTEVNLGGATSTLAASNVRIENFKSNLERLTDRPIVAGVETDHFRVTVDYDMTLRVAGVPLTRHVTTTIDSWTTTRFGDLGADFLTSDGTNNTGDPALDQLFAALKIPGFPMRQTITTKTRDDLPRATKSQLEVAQMRTSVREMWVTSIRETRGEGISFTVPASYARADMPDAPRAATKVLTFDPEGK